MQPQCREQADDPVGHEFASFNDRSMLARFGFGKYVQTAGRSIEYSLNEEFVEVFARNTDRIEIPWPKNSFAFEKLQDLLFFGGLHAFRYRREIFISPDIILLRKGVRET